MRNLVVTAPLRQKLDDRASDSLLAMFAEAHTLATESFERRLREEMSGVRLEISTLKFELLKWSFLFWIGQMAALAAVISLLLRNAR